MKASSYESSKRILLGVEYLGGAYQGWQRQADSVAVQTWLERVLSEVADQAVETICAGRTDRGVHATSQYVHFDCQQPRPDKAWLKGANSMLPADISIFLAKEVDEDFSARFSALDRTYVYYIYNAPFPSAIVRPFSTWIHYPLDEQRMHDAAQSIVGELNFSAFRSSQCQSQSVHRFVSDISVKRSGHLLAIEITANAFLHHMVRNIVGSLLEIGRGNQAVDWMDYLIKTEDRTQAGATAPPTGLFLCRVRYPEQYGLPDIVRYPLIMASNFSA